MIMTGEKKYEILLFNDSEHSFFEVMGVLMMICDHDKVQADQCSLITHNTGKCSIKVGNFDEIFEMQNQLSEFGLNVEMVEYQSTNLI